MICLFLHFFNLLRSLFYFTGSYSNNIFPPPLSSDEEEECISKMLSGDSDARNKLIEHNLRLVAHIVKKFEKKNIDTDDLISIGTIGLIKGIDSFNPSKNIKITTYVARCVENATFTSKNFLNELMTYLKELVHNYNFLIR